MITTFPIFSLRSTFGIESLWKFDLRPFLREIKEILAKKLLFLKTGAVNKDIKYKRKFIRQPSSSDNLQTSNNIETFWFFGHSQKCCTFEKTQKYYFLNTMKYIKSSLMKSSGKISREH